MVLINVKQKCKADCDFYFKVNGKVKCIIIRGAIKHLMFVTLI